MPRAPFSQADVTRALKAFKEADIPTAGVCFNKEGFCVMVGNIDQVTDEVPDNEVEEWIRAHARRT
jgi:hypothetical protein